MKYATFEDSAVEAEQEPERIVLRAHSEFSDRLQTVTSVIETYLRLKEVPAICAINIDPQPESRSQRWTVNGCHFIVDVESALRRFLVLRPDRITLRQAWEKLLEREDYSRVTGPERTLVMALAPVFVRTGIEPHIYFKTIKRGRA